MDNLKIGEVMIIPLIIAILAVLKEVGVNKKLLPIVAIVLGVASGFAVNGFDKSKIVESIYTGLALGLSAVGAYSSQKNIRENFDK